MGFQKGNTFGTVNKGRERLDMRREKNPRWNDGKCNTSNGYIEVISPRGHSTNTRGRILEHRLVMEQHLKRKLNKNEIVHHKNGNRKDNRIENLQLCQSQKEHLDNHPLSEEHKKRISRSMKGIIFTEEHRRNLSIALRGNTNGKK
jgi:hypothetical protein